MHRFAILLWLAPTVALASDGPAPTTATFEWKGATPLDTDGCPLRVGDADVCATPVRLPRTDGGWIRGHYAHTPLWLNPRPGGSYALGDRPCTDANLWSTSADSSARTLIVHHNAPRAMAVHTSMGVAGQAPVGEPLTLTLPVSANCPAGLYRVDVVPAGAEAPPAWEPPAKGTCRVHLAYAHGGSATLRCDIRSGEVVVH